MLPAQRLGQNYPYNGDFSQPVDGVPFNWQFISQNGADIDIVPREDDKSHALRIQFSGARISFSHVRELDDAAARTARFQWQGQS